MERTQLCWSWTIVFPEKSNTQFDQCNDEREVLSLSENLTKNTKACRLSPVWLLLCSGSLTIIGFTLSRCVERLGHQNMFYSLALMNNFTAGIFLPSVFICFFKALCVDQNESKTLITIVCWSTYEVPWVKKETSLSFSSLSLPLVTAGCNVPQIKHAFWPNQRWNEAAFADRWFYYVTASRVMHKQVLLNSIPG